MNNFEKQVANIIFKNDNEEIIIKKVVSLIRKEIGYKLLTFMIFNNRNNFTNWNFLTSQKVKKIKLSYFNIVCLCFYFFNRFYTSKI